MAVSPRAPIAPERKTVLVTVLRLAAFRLPYAEDGFSAWSFEHHSF